MSDESSTPPADTQAPPPQSGDIATGQASEPVTPPATESAPAEAPHDPETAQPEIAPTPEAPQTESAPEAPSGAVEASGESENLEAVIDTTPQNTPVATPEPQTAPAQSTTTVIRPHGDLALANAKIQESKRKKLDKIMAKLSEKGRITNDEVEKLLRVSDATTTRYLQTLEQENRIKQIGSTGTAVFYEKI